MMFAAGHDKLYYLRAFLVRQVCLVGLAVLLLPVTIHAAPPTRLVILLDGVSYRDVKALQEGITETDAEGRPYTKQAFHQKFFPVSRLISTFPSASDVAWTEILGNRPLPGYQRTYLSAGTGELVRQNGVTTSMEYELQMHWQMESGLRRALGYVYPHWSFKHEVREMTRKFMQAKGGTNTFYAMIRASDDAQHTVGDIFMLLSILDAELQQLHQWYEATEGRDLEILILSDHGNNRAGAGKRVKVQSFLRRAGYRVTERIRNLHDVVLPTVGIQNWVEVNCAASETESLAGLLADLEGVDVVTARLPGRTNQFLVVDAEHHCALIHWDPIDNSFRYESQDGDPLGYEVVVARLAANGQLDARGYAPADVWMDATIQHRYPLGLERIARGHTRIALNPAPILISLKNGYVHSSWLLKQFSSLMRMGGTHGALDDLCSNGIVLSNFTPTTDTSTRRVAGLFDDFEGLKDPRAGQNGAEWIYPELQALVSAEQDPVGLFRHSLPEGKPLLQIWTPAFSERGTRVPVEVTTQLVRRFVTPRIRRSDPVRKEDVSRQFTLMEAVDFPGQCEFERVYALPEDQVFAPLKTYRISGRIRDTRPGRPIFDFTFHTDSSGFPVVR